MKTLHYSLWGGLLLLTGAWLFSESTPFAALNGFFAWRGVLNQYTGALAMGVMSLAVILAVRPRWLEGPLDGLDKLYRLHKWLGIAGLTLAVTHWLLAKVPKWLVGWGWLERPKRGPRPPLEPGSLEQIFAQQRGLAESVGEWAFYAAAVLMILALIKWFPYRRFMQTHKWIAVAYLVLVFHSVVLVKFAYWSQPIGPLLAVLMALGSVAAVMSLFGVRASGRKAAGHVTAIQPYPALDALGVEIALAPGWPGHQAGQFAFVTLHGDEGAHPFTLASAWDPEQARVQVVIKSLGDYTGALAQRLRVGDAVQLEGPYGCFTFAGEARRQIWVAGGIGVTPFMARLQARAEQGDDREVDFFYCTAQYEPMLIEPLQALAKQAGVRLHVWWNQRDGRLDVAQLQARTPGWREADVWFCGPAGFGHSLREGLCGEGLPAARFHQELFEMR